MERFVGIDVGKQHLDMALLPDNTTVRVANDAGGWATLVARIGTAPTGIVVEATSTYHVGLVLALAAAGMPAAVMNPQRTAAFKTWAARHAKTDRHDARALAAFAQQQRPAPTPVPSQTVRALRELDTSRSGLVRTRIEHKNRLETATDVTRRFHEGVLAEVEAQRVALERQMAELVARDAALSGRLLRLRTVPGIGAVIGTTLVTGLPELGLVDAKALAALAGVAPYPRDSGATHGQRHCIGGRRHIAQALYQMAMTAVRWDPAMAAHYRQLRQRRPHKVAIVAVARRMLGLLNVMIRDDLDWQELDVVQAATVPAAA